MPPEKVSAIVESIVKTPLPPDVSNVYGRIVSVFTTNVGVRFSCSKETLDLFLTNSEVLSNNLEKGKRTMLNSMGNTSWWKPDELKDVSGFEEEWILSSGKAYGLLMAGKSLNNENLTVYLSVTIE